MPTPKIGVAATTLRRPLRQALDFASRCQADGVEFDLRNELRPIDLTPSAVRQLRKLMEDLRLSACSAAFPTRRGFDDPSELDRRLAGAAAAIKGAAELGARVLAIRSGIPSAEDQPDRRLQLVESLTLLARQAEHYGVQLALQTSADACSRLPELLADLPRPIVAACLDPAELIYGGESAAETAALLGPAIAHVYASDAVRDLAVRSAVTVELGRGSVDWPELLSLLEQHDYHGWTVIRLREGGAAEEVENAAAFLRAVGR